MGARCRHDLKTGRAVDVQFVRKGCPVSVVLERLAPAVSFLRRHGSVSPGGTSGASVELLPTPRQTTATPTRSPACLSIRGRRRSNRPADRRRNDEGIELRRYQRPQQIGADQRLRPGRNQRLEACPIADQFVWCGLHMECTEQGGVPGVTCRPAKACGYDGADRPRHVGRMPVDGACNSRNKPIQGTLIDGFCQVGLVAEAMHDATGRGAGGVADHGEGGGLESMIGKKRCRSIQDTCACFRAFSSAPGRLLFLECHSRIRF